MTAPKNNLQEILRQRSANTSVTVSSVETLSTGQRLAKFKPASNVQKSFASSSFSTNVEVHNAVTSSTSSPSLPSFSTPGFGKFKAAATHKDTSISYEASSSSSSSLLIPSSSSGSSLNSNHSESSSLKRSSSSDLAPPTTPAKSKRSKSSHNSQDDKENNPVALRAERVDKSPQKSRKDRIGSNLDPMGLQGFAFQASSSKTTVTLTTAPEPLKEDEGGLVELGADDWFSGLRDKSAGQLTELLKVNRDCLSHTKGLIADYEKGSTQPLDIVVMKYIKQIFDSRISAIKITLDENAQSLETNSIDGNPFASELSTSRLPSDPICPPPSKSTGQFDGSESEDEMWAALGDIPDLDVPPSPKAPKVDLTASPYYNEIMRTLKTVFQLDKFRSHQLEAINATMAGQDVFVLMPTGGGKSLCFQLPAVCHSGKYDGVTVVISPLIALMNDQVNALKAKGIDAELFNSDQDSELTRVVRSRLNGTGRKPRLLYITPERLQQSMDMRNTLARLLQNGQLARFVVDEAHTVSTWGRDFREAYKNLSKLRDDYPTVPIMALTATATPLVKADIKRVLQIPDCVFLESSFNRPNLNYEIRKKAKGVVKEIAEYIKTNHRGHTGIVYCFSRNKCEEVAAELRKHHINAKHYHAQLTPQDKVRTQEAWQKGECQVIVATIAFGMGIDKADVRFVIHHQIPKSMDGYYQETGRAGRDGKEADCILYFTWSDTRSMFNLIEKSESPPEEKNRQVEEIRTVVRYCYNDTDCRRVLVLNYFGQKFDSKNCHKKCDTCRELEGVQVVVKDMSMEGQQIIRLVDSMSRMQVTATQCLEVFKGSKQRGIIEKGYDKLPLYGAGQDMRDGADRVCDSLLHHGALKERLVNNAGGWSTAYVELGEHADEYLSGAKKLLMKFRVDEVAVQPKKKTGATATKKRTKSKTSRAGSKEQEQQEPAMSMYLDDIIDDDNF